MLRTGLIFALMSLSSCGSPTPTVDWRAAATQAATDAIGSDLGNIDPKYFDVRFVGDDKSGQTCGKVMGKGVSVMGLPARFIVYIDKTAGPYVEGQRGLHTVDDERFDYLWQMDCVNEGWYPD